MEELGNVPMEGMTVLQKISNAVSLRLMKQGAMISTWPQALALQALPSNAASAITGLAKTCDTACNLGGPAPVDMNWFRCVSVYVRQHVRCRTHAKSVCLFDTRDSKTRPAS